MRLIINNKCNNNCTICPFVNHKSNFMNIKDIENEILDSDDNITLAGGEIFLHNNINDILRLCDSKNLTIETNGRIFSNIEYIMKYKRYINTYSVFLFNDIQSQGNIKQTFLGIRNLIIQKCDVIVNFVITYDILNDIIKYLKIIYNLGVRKVKIIFTEPIIGKESLFNSIVPDIHIAKPVISRVLNFINEKNMILIPNDMNYSYEKPKDLIKDKYKVLKKSNENVKVSVVIPTSNRREHLQKVLDALSKQTDKRFEVVIVDDNSEDGTFNFIKTDLPLTYIYWFRKEKFSPGKPLNRAGPVRNLGVEYSKGDIIVFLDTDIVVCENFIQEHIKSHDKFDIVVGPSVREREGYDVRFQYTDIYDNIMDFPAVWTLCHEGNISVKKNDFLSVGGFSDEFVYWAVEGDDLFYRMIRYNDKIATFNKNATGIHLWHSPESVDRDTLSKGMIYNGTILYKKHLSDEVYDRYFIIDDKVEIDSISTCMNRNQKMNRLARFTDCIEHKKCKFFSVCKGRHASIKKLFMDNGYIQNYFFRIDDIGIDDKKCKKMIDIFIKNSIPVNLAVIPKRISQDMIDYLRMLIKKYPGLIEIHQHGYSHSDYGDNKSYEFGDKRTYVQQWYDIKRGMDMLTELFGDDFKKIFIPPYHGYNSDTIKALKALRFDAISKWEDDNNIDFSEVSCNVDFVKDYDTNKQWSENEIIEQIIIKRDKGGNIGLLLHHNHINDFKILSNIIYILCEKYNFKLMSVLIKKSLNKIKLNSTISALINDNINLDKIKSNSYHDAYISDKKYFVKVRKKIDIMFMVDLKNEFDFIFNNKSEILPVGYFYDATSFDLPYIVIKYLDMQDADIKIAMESLAKLHNIKSRVSLNLVSYHKLIKKRSTKILEMLSGDKQKILMDILNRFKIPLIKIKKVIHGDMDLEHTTSSGKIIDFETVCYGDPAYDLASILFYYLKLDDDKVIEYVDYYLKFRKDQGLLARVFEHKKLILLLHFLWQYKLVLGGVFSIDKFNIFSKEDNNKLKAMLNSEINKNRILLINPSYQPHWSKCEPTGLLRLCASLENAGFTCEILDMNVMNINDEKMLDILNKYNPFMVGITTLTCQADEAYRIGKLIKRNNFLIKILYGGVHPTFYSKEPFFKGNADFVIKGEAENGIVDLSHAIINNNNYDIVSGLVYKTESGLHNNTINIFKDLNQVKHIDYSKIPLKRYNTDIHIDEFENLLTVHINTSRGCTGNCMYCASPAMYKRNVRYFDIDYVVDEIKNAMTNGVKAIHFHDDNFMLDSNRLIELCDRIKNLGIKWNCLATVGTINNNPSVLKVMKESGCVGIEIGVESGDERVYKYINKTQSKDDVIRAVRNIKSAELVPMFLMMSYAPGDTIDTPYLSWEFVKELQGNGLPKLMGHHARASPGAGFWHMRDNLGLILVNKWSEHKEENITFIPFSFLNDIPIKKKNIDKKTFIHFFKTKQRLIDFLSKSIFYTTYNYINNEHFCFNEFIDLMYEVYTTINDKNKVIDIVTIMDKKPELVVSAISYLSIFELVRSK